MTNISATSTAESSQINYSKNRTSTGNIQKKSMESPILAFKKSENDNINKDFTKEIYNSKKEDKKSFWDKYSTSIGFGLAAGIASFALFSNAKMSKQLANLTSKLAQTTSELNATKASLKEAENVLTQIQQIANTPAKTSLRETLANSITRATKGLRLTNEFSSEVGRLCDNVINIKGKIG